MSEYTPTTAQIKEKYVEDTIPIDIAEVEFDRWLAGVKAKAWDQGGVAGYDAGRGIPSVVNPYRKKTT
jgi:hypothetical protein